MSNTKPLKVDRRWEIHRIVSALKPLDSLEGEHIRDVLEWIESGNELCRIAQSATPETHLVSYFVLASPELDRILLVDHRQSGLWLPPGGHVEPGEDPKETVRREAQEELGIVAEFLFDAPLLLSVSQTVGTVAQHTDVSLWYLLKGDPRQLLEYDPRECHRVHWFRMHEIPFQKSDPHLMRFLQKMLEETRRRHVDTHTI